MTSNQALFMKYSIDNGTFAFTEIEDAITASLSKNGIPNDNIVQICSGVFYSEMDIDPVRRSFLHVEVQLTGKLDIIGYDIRSATHAV